MSDVKWTPGPWKIADETDGRSSINGPGDQSISDAWRLRPEVDHRANANLIAAAPELWDELYETHSALIFKDPEYLGSIRYKRNAMVLAKAKGGQQ